MADTNNMPDTADTAHGIPTNSTEPGAQEALKNAVQELIKAIIYQKNLESAKKALADAVFQVIDEIEKNTQGTQDIKAIRQIAEQVLANVLGTIPLQSLAEQFNVAQMLEMLKVLGALTPVSLELTINNDVMQIQFPNGPRILFKQNGVQYIAGSATQSQPQPPFLPEGDSKWNEDAPHNMPPELYQPQGNALTEGD